MNSENSESINTDANKIQANLIKSAFTENTPKDNAIKLKRTIK